MSFLASLRERASATSARIGFPEAREVRTRQAIRRLYAEGRVQPVVVEHLDEIADLIADLPGIEHVDPADGQVRTAARAALPEPDRSRMDTLTLSVGLLKAGLLDGVVAGAQHATAEVVRAGLRALGTARGIRTASSAFYMIVPPRAGQDEHVLTFTDAAVVPHPDARQLAEIAEAASRARRLLVGDEPRVAFLSYSTHGSAGGESVTRMREALRIFREQCPQVVCDGELQADAALSAEVAARKAPGSPVGGLANVLVFPDLNAANIGYKLVQRIGGAQALGPILQGLDRPLNDLSRGASIDDIIHVTYITAVMGGDRIAAARDERRSGEGG